MSKKISFLGNVFVYSTPLTVIASVIPDAQSEKIAQSSFSGVFLIFGIAILAWILSGMVLFFVLTFNRAARETMLAKFARLKERDEREEVIVGRAARSSFLFYAHNSTFSRNREHIPVSSSSGK